MRLNPLSIQNTLISIRNRYAIALTLIAVLTIGAQLIVQNFLATNEGDSRVVNLAGRQRMLSQRITKNALALLSDVGDDDARYITELEISLRDWVRAHEGLQHGDAELGLPGVNSTAVTDLFAQADPYHILMRDAAYCLLAIEQQTDLPANCPNTTVLPYAQTILENEQFFLPLMDKIVFQYDDESKAKIDRLRNAEILTLVLTLVTLGVEALFIFRPTTIRLRHTLHDLLDAQDELAQNNALLEERVKQRTRELEQTNTELKVANQEIQGYVHTVSHDLRSPIASMRGFANELAYNFNTLKNDLPEHPVVKDAIPEAMTAIQDSLGRMERMTKGLLTVAREGQRVLNWQTVDTQSIVEHVVQSFQPQAKAQNATITVGNLPPLTADATAFEQIMTNMVSNALKFLCKDRAGEIVISGENTANKVLVYVADNGRGIAPNEQGKLFQLFRRLGAQDTEGEGVGLYYVQTAMKRHNGRISLVSTEGQGTTFTLEFPKTTA